MALYQEVQDRPAQFRRIMPPRVVRIGQVGQALVGRHQIKVVIRMDIKDVEHLVQHLAMLRGDPDLRLEKFGATPQFKADTTGGVVRYDFSRPLAKPERLLERNELGLGSPR